MLSPDHATSVPPHVHGATRRSNLLLSSSLITMPYRVMRVANAAGANVFILGGPKSRGLRYSRYCKKFQLTMQPMTGERDLGLASEINECIAACGIEMVMPGDVEAMRSLLAVRDLLHAPCFPMPDLERFDYLNNKWHFTNLCQSLGILCPNSWLFSEPAALITKLEGGEIALPLVVKPVNRDSGLGVMSLDAANARTQIAKIDYAPIMVQEFIAGADIGASVYCEGGIIKAFIAHELRRATYRVLDQPGILATLTRIIPHFNCDGVFNFDMRLAPDGMIYYLECNPRFFFKIDLSMLAGINFVSYGLKTAPHNLATNRIGDVRLQKALALAMLTPWRVSKRDLVALWYLWGDPISHLREAMGIDWEHPADAAKTRHFAKVAPKEMR